jgi:hypothetical protein
LNILPMPMPANDKGTLTIIDSVLEGLTINTKAKEKAAAVKLLAWMGTPKVAADHLQFSGGGSTPIRGASDFIPDTRATKSIRELGKFVDQMGSVRFDQQPYTPTAFGRDVQSRIFDVIRETMVAGGTAQDVATQLDALLKQTKQENRTDVDHPAGTRACRRVISLARLADETTLGITDAEDCGISHLHSPCTLLFLVFLRVSSSWHLPAQPFQMGWHCAEGVRRAGQLRLSPEG